MHTAPFSAYNLNLMDYEKDIINILYEAGNTGLSVHKIAIHVHNSRNTLFAPIAFDEVRYGVQKWLLANSRYTSSLVEHCDKRGMYRINLKSQEAQKLMLQFGDNADDHTSASSTTKDASQPLLFDF